MSELEPNTALAPCPFCGGEAEILNNKGSDYYEIRVESHAHNDCFMNVTIENAFSMKSKEDAIEQWNTRHESETKAQAVEAVKNQVLSDLDNSSDWWDYERVEKWFIDYAQQLRDSKQ